ncbi:hypothetical protein Fmac_000398 [Flemingia macrophylla]|uniref:Proline dehydrogenase n=1 Tax=Flemingia macrophylla TaxID=520843 RepID=A0ABD1NFQ2_9FABA
MKLKTNQLYLVLEANDHHKLFSHLPTSDLLRFDAVLHATVVDPLVDFGTWLLHSNLMNVNGLREIRLASVRHSFYNHFCSGEDAPAVAKSIRALSRADLRGMLVYSIEDALDNHACDRNFHASFAPLTLADPRGAAGGKTWRTLRRGFGLYHARCLRRLPSRSLPPPSPLAISVMRAASPRVFCLRSDSAASPRTLCLQSASAASLRVIRRARHLRCLPSRQTV